MCGAGHVRWNPATGVVGPVRCRRRRCPECGPIWRAVKKAQFWSGTAVPLARLKLITLTAPGDEEVLTLWKEAVGDQLEEYSEDTWWALAVSWWNDGAPERFNHWVLVLHRAFPWMHLQYWKVAEFQVRGLVHYHVMVRGVCDVWIAHERLRELALAARFGRICFINQIKPRLGGVRGAIAYMAKYLLKASGVDWPARRRLVTESQEWRLTWEDRRPPRSASGTWSWFPWIGAMVQAARADGWSWLTLQAVERAARDLLALQGGAAAVAENP